MVKNVFLLLAFLCYNSLSAQNWIKTSMGGGGWFMCAGAGPTGTILVGSDLSGAFRSTDGGLSWNVIGPNNGMTATHIRTTGFDPVDGDIFYLGTNIGLYRTTDGGDDMDQVLSGGTITDVKFSPINSNIGYLTRHPVWNAFNAEVYRSTDRGVTWSNAGTGIGLPNDIKALKLILHPNDPDSLFLLSGRDRFICGDALLYASGDAGISWVQLATTVSDSIAIMDFAIDPWDHSTFYLTTMNTECGQTYYVNSNLKGDILKSTDGGVNWVDPNPQDDNHSGVIWFSPDNPGHIRLIDPRLTAPWKSRSGTFLSQDFGVTWSQIGDENTWDTFFLEGLRPDQDNIVKASYGGTGAVCRTLGEDLSNPDSYFWVNTRFTHRTTNGGVTFQNMFTDQDASGGWRSRGVDNVILCDIAVSPVDPDVVYAGYADNGLWRSLNGGESWESSNANTLTGNWNGLGGNTQMIAPDPDRPEVVWATLQGSTCCYNANLVRSDSFGQRDSWQPSDTGLPSSKKITDLSIDPNSDINMRTMFVVVQGDIYKSTDDGSSWSLSFNEDGLSFVEVDPSLSSRIYAGGSSGLFRSEDHGASWSQIASVTFSDTGNSYSFWSKYYRGVSCIHPSSCEAGVLYVSSYGPGKGLYRSSDAGMTFTKVLDDDYMRTVLISKTDHKKLYAGSSYLGNNGGSVPANAKGFLISEDEGLSWTDLSHTLDYPSVTVLRSNGPHNERLYGISQGTGPMWWQTDNQAYVYYEDDDMDGYGSSEVVERSCSSFAPIGFSSNDQDCDDTDPNVYPGAPEINLNGKDENCDGLDFNLIPVSSISKPQNEISMNPSRKSLGINTRKETHLFIRDIKGSLLIQIPLGKGKNDVDLSVYPTGLYLMQVVSGSSNESFKVVLE